MGQLKPRNLKGESMDMEAECDDEEHDESNDENDEVRGYHDCRRGSQDGLKFQNLNFYKMQCLRLRNFHYPAGC